MKGKSFEQTSRAIIHYRKLDQAWSGSKDICMQTENPDILVFGIQICHDIDRIMW